MSSQWFTAPIALFMMMKAIYVVALRLDPLSSEGEQVELSDRPRHGDHKAPTGTRVGNEDADHRLFVMMPRTGWSMLHEALAAHDNSMLQESYYGDMFTMNTSLALDFMSKVPPEESVLIVSFLRNPFSQMVSWYFEKIGNNCCGGQDMAAGLNATTNLSANDLHTDFERNVPGLWWNTYSQWIKKDLAHVSGIDLSSLKFDPEKRSLFVRHADKNISLLMLRIEDIVDWDSVAAVHLPQLQLAASVAQKHDDSQKWYANYYKQFIDTYKFSEQMCREVQHSDAWHCYSDAEHFAFLRSAGCTKGPSPANGRVPALNVESLGRAKIMWEGSQQAMSVAWGRWLSMHDLSHAGWDRDDEADGYA